MFQAIDKIFGVTGLITDKNFPISSYIVPFDHYKHLHTLFKGYKFTLAPAVIKYMENLVIRPLFLAEPVDIKEKKILFSTEIVGFLRPYEGKLTAFVDVSPKARYMRNKLTNEIDLFNIFERDFFAYMQSSLILKLLYENNNSLNFNGNFTKAIAEIYSFYVTKCIGAIYPVNSTVGGVNAMNFISACYCFQNFFGYDVTKAKQQALTLKGTDRQTVTSECVYYRHDEPEIDMNPTASIYKNTGSNQIYPIDTFLNILMMEFPFIKSDKIEYRNIIGRWVQMYGKNAVLAFEHAGTFVNMIATACMRVGLFNDMTIDKTAAGYVADIEKILNTLV
jgi:hypothetical protein